MKKLPSYLLTLVSSCARLLTGFLFPVSASPVHAQITNPLLITPGTQINDPVGYTNTVIQSVFSIFMLVGILYFCWFIFMAAFHLIDAQGDAKKIEESKKEFTNGLIGITTLFSLFAILKVVGSVFGLKGLESLEIFLPIL